MDGLIKKVFPGWGLRREVARRRLKRLENTKQRSFDSISGNRLRYDLVTDSGSPDSSIVSDSNSLRTHIRQLEKNNGFVSGPIKRIASNVVGRGIRFQSGVVADTDRKSIPKINEENAKRANKGFEDSFKLWNRQADVKLIHTFFEIQKLVEGALIRDGESIVVARRSNKKNRFVPFCLEVFETDRLMTPFSEVNNPKIRKGMEFDDEGAVKTYFLLKQHPGESFQAAFDRAAFDEIQAYNDNGTQKVFFLFNPLRPEQTRGFTQFASGLKDFQDLDRYTEAEKMAALEDACMTGTVISPDPEEFAANYTTPGNMGADAETDQNHEFAPLKWNYFNPGTEVKINSPSRPNSAFGEFVDQLLRGPANGLNIPPEVLTQNWRNMNYSNARTVLLQFYKSCTERQDYLINHLCIPVMENLIREFIAHGKAQAIGFNSRPEAFLKHSWIPPGWQWVDPKKEAEGKQIDVNNNFDTLSDIAASRGKDIDEVIETRAKEEKMIKDAEIKYGVSLKSTQNTEPVVDEVEIDEEEDENNNRALKVV